MSHKPRKDIEDFADFGNPAETSVQHVNTMLRVMLDVLLDIRDLLTPTSSATFIWSGTRAPETNDDADDTRLAT